MSNTRKKMSERRSKRLCSSEEMENNYRKIRLRCQKKTEKEARSQIETGISRGRVRKRVRNSTRQIDRNSGQSKDSDFEKINFCRRPIITYDDDVFQSSDHTDHEIDEKYSTTSRHGDIHLPLNQLKTEPISAEESVGNSSHNISLSKFQNSNNPKHTIKSNRIGEKYRHSNESLKTESDDKHTPTSNRTECTNDHKNDEILRMISNDSTDKDNGIYEASNEEQTKTCNTCNNRSIQQKSKHDRKFLVDIYDPGSEKEQIKEVEECKNRPSSPFSSISENTSYFSSIYNPEDQPLTITSFMNLHSSERSEFIAKAYAELVSLKVTNENEEKFTVFSHDFCQCLQDIGIYFESESSFIQIFEFLSENFCLDNNQMSIEPRTKLKICESYTKDINVKDCDCSCLHMCKFDLVGHCMAERCKFSHKESEMHNQDVLKSHCLYKLPPQHLRKLLNDVNNRNSTTSPNICKFYNNEGGCSRKERCQHLHVCKHFVTKSCKFGPGCKRAHNFKSNHSREILYKFGLEKYQYNYEVLFPLIISNMENGVIKIKRMSSENLTPIKHLETSVKERLSFVDEDTTIPSRRSGRYFSLDRGIPGEKEIKHIRTNETVKETELRKNKIKTQYRSCHMAILEQHDENVGKFQTRPEKSNCIIESKAEYRKSKMIAEGPVIDKRDIYQRNVNSNLKQELDLGKGLSNKKRKGKGKLKETKKRRIGKIADGNILMTREPSHMHERSRQKSTNDGTCIASTVTEPSFSSSYKKEDITETEAHVLANTSNVDADDKELVAKVALSETLKKKEVDIRGEKIGNDFNHDKNKGLMTEVKGEIISRKTEQASKELNKTDGKVVSEEDACTFVGPMVSPELVQPSQVIDRINSSTQITSKSTSEGGTLTRPSIFRGKPCSEEIWKKATKPLQSIEVKEDYNSYVLTAREDHVDIKISGTSATDLQNKIRSTVSALLDKLKSMGCKLGIGDE